MPLIDGPDYASIAETIGLTTLRALYPSLTGQGVTVGQVEGSSSGTQNGIDFEVDPASLGHPADNADHFLTYINGAFSTFVYNDGVLGRFSNHATVQASFFYNPAPYLGTPIGVAPGVDHINNYNADYFPANLLAPVLADKVVNLSVVYEGDPGIDALFGGAANRFGTVFVAAAGNGGAPGMPSSAYNVISVDTWPGIQAIGPAPNGAAKPDISAPQTVTSRSTAIVSGAATLLVQAGQDGIGGTGAQARADATDFRSIKALLLNGADKPADYDTTIYAPTAEHPLNAVYGAGIVNIANAVATLAAGEHAAQTSVSVPTGAEAFAPNAAAPLAATGWNLATLTTLAGLDAVHGYSVALTAGIGFTATLTWAADDTNTIHHLALYLYDAMTGALLASSTSQSSNVQQVRFTADHAGTLALQVALRAGGQIQSDRYALAYRGTASVACFTAGTRILGQRGDIPIEHLIAGDRVVTASGRLAPIRAILHRDVDPMAQPNPQAAIPILICRNAIGPGMPRHDLLVSPDHALAMRDTAGVALIPARLLVNGTSVRPGPSRKLRYFHLVLDRHEIIHAEGLPTESFHDSGNRADFDNPEALPDHAPQPRCAKLLMDGARLHAHHARINARSRNATDADPTPVLRCDGTWLAPVRTAAGQAAFAVPAGATDIHLVTRSSRPRWHDAKNPDTRRLGLPVTRIRHAGVTLGLDCLRDAHDIEHDGPVSWRWTNGSARLLVPDSEMPSVLEIDWAPGWLRYWQAGAREKGDWSE